MNEGKDERGFESCFCVEYHDGWYSIDIFLELPCEVDLCRIQRAKYWQNQNGVEARFEEMEYLTTSQGKLPPFIYPSASILAT